MAVKNLFMTFYLGKKYFLSRDEAKQPFRNLKLTVRNNRVLKYLLLLQFTL